ncbi:MULTISPECIES: helix-turn-helix domain-containing protein [Flavobacterium]|uniref:helix-turn-helix domain-containing protein n=1 Tax=Flavobacterium TaxID=237 RepID=UPI001FCC6743|nr:MULTISPECIES: helix-turn-helix domain-containing protein [Flavobacterium]UOK41628.1 helix-turn-helix domain-containing protein [Flavobacterium enshiense]UOK42145.1 helix-turn-helix domain-containing protein [Flavobacterium enshiense]UOK42192.1 helix-turn-helix domain-containing protein [Flavobacterium enshiense]UOK42230.1 helix-turn-helix domain-containing protein [Flavobacterium enshiense]UOK42236.1 helix-turn-helix domain-containing protein [Flavobacterium enshiense]
METTRKQPCRKNEYQKISFDLKLSIIDEINNGQISVNYAAKKYGISRSSIDYWRKKLSNFTSKSKAMSKNDEIKKLRERIEELEFIKDFQQDIIADFEVTTGLDIAKKSLPETLVKEIEKKKRNLLK